MIFLGLRPACISTGASSKSGTYHTELTGEEYLGDKVDFISQPQKTCRASDALPEIDQGRRPP